MEKEREIKMKLNLPDHRWEYSHYRLLSTMNLSDDFHVTSYPVDRKLRLFLYNRRELSPGVSDIYKAGGGVQAHINESFLLQSGFYAMRYTHNFIFSLCLTPKRCSSSIINKPKSLIPLKSELIA